MTDVGRTNAAQPISDGLRATVRGAARLDADRGIVRLGLATMRRLRLRAGDLVALTGGRRHVARVLPDQQVAEETASVALCPVTCTNCGVMPGDSLTVEAADLPQATVVRLIPSDRPNGVARGTRQYCRERLMDRPVMPGDRVAVDIPGTGRVIFEVALTEPDGGGCIGSETRLDLGAGAAPKARQPYPEVGGLAEPIARLREMVDLPLRRPDLFAHLGITPPRGVLFTGPPGSGKTLLARAVAQASEARFFQINGPEIISKHYGDSEARLREVFGAAAKQAPAILFIDEIDAIAPRRDAVSGEKQLERRVVAQLLTLMDGLSERGRVVVIAATNLPHMLDPALRRPGRFDREIPFPAPDLAARREILGVHLAAMPLAPDVAVEDLARRSHGYVGADLAALSREAAMAALARMGAAQDPDLAAEAIEVNQADFDAGFAATGPSALRELRVEVPETRLCDVGGLAPVKQALTEAILWPLAHPAASRALGVEAPSGILLAGPPGSGKTMLARALACESEMNFIPVRGARLLSQYLGEAERLISELFSRARHAAPCLLFLDEMDALAPVRSGSDPAMTRVVAQLLVEIDGIEAVRGVVLLAATNRVGAIDPALLRPGRFDRIIETGLPGPSERQEILALQGRRYPIDPLVDLQDLAARTHGWSGAALAGLCQTAARHALRRLIAADRADVPGTWSPGPDGGPSIGVADFLTALEERIASDTARTARSGICGTVPEGDTHAGQ